jgi:exodeoxyribonuclease VII small subunit
VIAGGTPPPGLSDARALAELGSFEETLAALEAVVDILERGQLAIDDAVAWYEVGLALSQRCATLLDEAELKISALDDLFQRPATGTDGWIDNDP